MLLVGAVAMVAPDDFKNLMAGYYEKEVRTVPDREQFVEKMLSYGNRHWLDERVRGQRVQLNVTFQKALGYFEVKPNSRPLPFFQLQTKLCPNSDDREATISFFVHDAQDDQFGEIEPGKSVFLGGTFHVSEVRERQDDGGPFCFIDLYNKS